MTHDPLDLIDRSAESNCCGAPIYLGDLCLDCGEHCQDERDEPEVEEEET